MATIKKGQTLTSYRGGTRRTVIGFTTKPDGRRRARLADKAGNEKHVVVDNIAKAYRLS